ncbi:DUF4815 domain-containing protein, partial [Desulfosarcina sp. OttesenSCG-928-G10]|nr:DUF4815 domain-containing protein [Desulfosarcina sp. OttesenSCG-928-G10]
DTVDWSLSGAEPATGSTYSVTYTYMVSATPQDPDYDGFTVEGAVAGSSIIVTYSQALPRKDRLCLTQDGAYVWYRGVASEQNPRSPEIPAGVLPLATVFQSWRDDVDVDNDGSVSVSFSFLAALTKRVDYALAEVARTRLETDISTREAGARAGIFVDPLTDDTNRDQGIEQTAAVFDGVMTLGAGVTTHRLENPKNTPAFPAFTPTPIISQLFRTGEMKVNPYMAFGTLPAALTLTPAIDQWTETDTVWTSAVTKVVTYRSLNSWDDADLSTNTEVVSSTVSDLEYLRPIDVQFDIADFDAGEVLDAVIFDGITVAHSPSIIAADSAGKASGTFTIPEKVLAGAKTVSIIGKNGSFGGAPFVGQGKLNVQTLRNVRNWATVMGSKVGERFSTISLQIVDPLAQTFVLDSAAQICGVDLWFVAKSTDVLVQIREVQTGLPTSVILAEARIKPEDIVVTGGGHTRILFDSPVPLQAGIEYCFVVLCNDSETAVSVAEGGKYDDYRQEWVASQPYTVGVLLSSSNASTWTAHQNLDMTFRLLACAFVPGTHVVTMGTAQLTNATDLVLHALDETPTSDALVQYQIILPGSETLTVASGQAVRLPSPTTGMVSVMARLTGTQKSAPLLWPDALLLAGELLETGDYYSRSITALDAIKATLIYDAIIPSGASVTPEIQIDSGEWEALPLAGTVIQGDQVVEYTHTKPLNNAALAKVRFTLSGNTSSRPFVGNVRFMATK